MAGTSGCGLTPWLSLAVTALAVWLAEYLSVPLELDVTNDETCRILCIP